jgi:tRNA threonylcarbamoyladenosine biosynthesis protein TsaB
MKTLAIDSSDARGGVALRINGDRVSHQIHREGDYSGWLIPAVENVLAEAGETFSGLDLIAVSVGPGSFTGVRTGLTTVKAWAEVYDKPVAGVSRLEAIASRAASEGLVAVSYDARRGQVFGGLFRKVGSQMNLLGDEMVIAPGAFVSYVLDQSRNAAVRWLSLDPEVFTSLSDWKVLEEEGGTMARVTADLADAIGEIGEGRAARGELTDVLQLDANYVRRSDAEIFWKGPAKRVG